MSDSKNRRDFYSGVPWVNVTPQQARAHPKGQLGVVLWAIALYFLASAAWKFYVASTFDVGVMVVLLNGIWPLLAGVGLILRVPWSVFMAIVSAATTVWAVIRSSRATATLYNSSEGAASMGFLQGVFGIDSYGDAFFVLLLVELIIHIGILFHLMDGDRPNLIYRHRYRQYSAARDDG